MTILRVGSGLPEPDENSSKNDPIILFVEGPYDTTVRPVSPAVRKLLEADRENVERFVAWAKQQQEELNAASRVKHQPKAPEDPPTPEAAP